MEIKELQALKTRFVTREVGNELILVPLSQNVAQMSELFTMNETARFIWGNSAETNSIDDMVSLMTDNFNIDKETAQKDIALFLDKLETLFAKKVS
jgi:Coenzyme PQQ synthesis protein D (PqqD)